jgi:diguanylate cyclase (GGDEF)-like protein
VNDTLGHPQGDAVLKIISKLIKKEVRAIDLAGRYGGEEFVVLLPETGYGEESSSATGALVVAERIRKAIDDEFRGMQKPLSLTVSIGVAVRRFPQDRDADYRELVRWADEELYRAKTTGKNKACVYEHEKSSPVS